MNASRAIPWGLACGFPRNLNRVRRKLNSVNDASPIPYLFGSKHCSPPTLNGVQGSRLLTGWPGRPTVAGSWEVAANPPSTAAARGEGPPRRRRPRSSAIVGIADGAGPRMEPLARRGPCASKARLLYCHTRTPNPWDERRPPWTSLHPISPSRTRLPSNKIERADA